MARQRGSWSGFAALAALVAVLNGTSAAGAATPEGRAAAKQQLARAEELKKQGKLADACAALAEVERLDPKLPTLLDLAECTESLGKVVEAQALWTAARDRAKHDEKPQSRARAESRLAAVEKRVAHLTLQLAPNVPPGVQVLLDDVAIEAATLPSALAVNPGDHVVIVKLAGHDDAKYALKLGDGDNQSLPVAAGPAATARAAAALLGPAPLPAASTPTKVTIETSAPSAPPPATGWWSAPRKAGVISGLVGLAAIGGGTALLVGSKAGRVDSSATLGGVSIVTGSVLFVSGLVLLASTPRDEAPQQAHLRVAPTLTLARGATVIGAVGEF